MTTSVDHVHVTVQIYRPDGTPILDTIPSTYDQPTINAYITQLSENLHRLLPIHLEAVLNRIVVRVNDDDSDEGAYQHDHDLLGGEL